INPRGVGDPPLSKKFQPDRRTVPPERATKHLILLQAFISIELICLQHKLGHAMSATIALASYSLESPKRSTETGPGNYTFDTWSHSQWNFISPALSEKNSMSTIFSSATPGM